MNDDQTAPQPAPPAPEPAAVAPTPDATSESRTAWSEVGSALDELIQAIGRWAKTLNNDPEHKQHVAELKQKLDSLGSQIGSAVESAAESDLGKSLGEAADKTGEAISDVARKVSAEVSPHLAGAFRSAAEGMRKAAESLDRRAHERSAEQVTSEQPTPPADRPDDPSGAGA